jgi:putative ABC transport system permease protein
MAMLLFAMIISTVTIMTIVIEATQTIVAPDEERTAGFEISTSASLLSFFDPLEDLEQEIAGVPDFPLQDVDTVGSVATLRVDAQQVGADDVDSDTWKRASLVGVNGGYLDQAESVYSFGLRAPGYDSDEAVWAALRRGDDVAVVTKNLLGSATFPAEDAAPAGAEAGGEPDEGRGPGRRHGRWLARQLRLTGVSEDDEKLPEMRLSIRASEDEASPVRQIQVIGIIDQPSTLAGDGVLVHQRALESLTGETVVPDNFYIKVREGADVRAVAQALERALLPNATNATVMAESFAQGQAVTRGILRLLQGFLALGLLVGVAALGVISTRTVVERRQQVGMLRAIGYQSRMVALSFLIESSFIALTGIMVGTIAGVVLGQNMVGVFFDVLTDGRVFDTPWLQIAGIVLIAYGFSLVTTILPSYQASRIYPAEALRYE